MGAEEADQDDDDAAMAKVATEIVLFRNICMVLARKGQLPPMLEVRHAALELRLRTAGGRGRKQPFRRFPCHSPAELAFEHAGAKPTSATLVELAVDGARLVVEGHDRVEGDPCLLSVDIKSPQGLRTIAFASRVESASADELRVLFDGPLLSGPP